MQAIYVRECYPRLIERIMELYEDFDETNKDIIPIDGIILTGSSGLFLFSFFLSSFLKQIYLFDHVMVYFVKGVGKSVFAYYFMRHLIKINKSFIYSTGSSSSNNFYFCDNKLYEIIGSITSMDADYFIIDGKELTDIPVSSKTLVISANEKYYKDYQKSMLKHEV